MSRYYITQQLSLFFFFFLLPSSIDSVSPAGIVGSSTICS